MILSCGRSGRTAAGGAWMDAVSIYDMDDFAAMLGAAVKVGIDRSL
jgi:hypothetical protein